jgi:hypothetical protein
LNWRDAEISRLSPHLAGETARDHTSGVIPETLYAKTSDGVHIAYQVLGEGPVDFVAMPGSSGNVEIMWEKPTVGRPLSQVRFLLATDPA